MTVGEFDELSFAEMLQDTGLGDALENWPYWHRPLSRGLDRADVLAVQRAVATIERSWAP
ncbi:hypothetical protein D3C79_1061830 [compost metagenome]